MLWSFLLRQEEVPGDEDKADDEVDKEVLLRPNRAIPPPYSSVSVAVDASMNVLLVWRNSV